MSDLIQKEINLPVDDRSPAIKMLAEHVQMLDMCHKLASHYCTTDLVPKAYYNKPENAAVAIQWGGEIGLSPLQALQNIAVINGNPSLWGDSLIALVRGSGLCEYLHNEYNAETQTATVTTKRVGSPVEESRTFSMSDAKIAGLASRDTYKRFPQRMLTNRARSYLLRDVYADVLKGLRLREIEEEEQQFVKPEKDVTPAKKSNVNALLSKKPLKATEQAKEEKPGESIEEAQTAEPVPEINDLELIRDHLQTVTDKTGYIEAQEMYRSAVQSGKYSKEEINALYTEIVNKGNQLRG